MTLQTSTPAPHIRIESLTFDYGGKRPAVDRLSFDIAKGEFIGLLGPSGCGKSTTLRMFAGLLAPTSGRITIGGQDIVSRPPWERNLGLVFQSYALFPHMTVAQNVAFGLKLRKIGREEIRARVTEALRAVRLETFGERRPSELSGGQQQRVAIARAIAPRPRLIFADEPTGNLDVATGHEIIELLFARRQQAGATLLVITHDPELAARCDRIITLADGRIASDTLAR